MKKTMIGLTMLAMCALTGTTYAKDNHNKNTAMELATQEVVINGVTFKVPESYQFFNWKNIPVDDFTEL